MRGSGSRRLISLPNITALVVAIILLAPPHGAAAQTLQTWRLSIDFWVFLISHTDPDTRLTRIDFTDLPIRTATGYGGALPYMFTMGDLPVADTTWNVTSGWRIGGSTATSFFLVNDAGFQGTAELHAMDLGTFYHDAYIPCPDRTDPTCADRLLSWQDLENVTFTTVTPEPGGALLITAGLAAIAALRRRRSMASAKRG